jgi:hypothetical protein
MVWLNRLPIPLGRRGGNFLVQMISTAFPRVEEGGGGRHPVGPIHSCFINQGPILFKTGRCSEKTSVEDPDPYSWFKVSAKFRVLYKVLLLGCPCPDITYCRWWLQSCASLISHEKYSMFVVSYGTLFQNPELRIRITLMRIRVRIHLFTLMRNRNGLFTLMRIRIPPPPPRLHFEPLRLHFESQAFIMSVHDTSRSKIFYIY